MYISPRPGGSFTHAFRETEQKAMTLKHANQLKYTG